MKAQQVTDAALIAGVTLRLTRLVTADGIGDRYVRRPVEQWAHTYDTVNAPPRALYSDGTPKESLPEFLVEGFSCPHCVSFHAAWITLASYAVARRRPGLLTVWRAGASALTLSAAVGHISARID